jgi:hypothetical protein
VKIFTRNSVNFEIFRTFFAKTHYFRENFHERPEVISAKINFFEK